MIYPKRYIC